MLTADYFREQADALYNLAKGTPRAAERLELVLEAMEFEARAVDAERGKIVPPYVVHANLCRDCKPAYKPGRAVRETPRQTVEADWNVGRAEAKELHAQARQIGDTKTRA